MNKKKNKIKSILKHFKRRSIDKKKVAFSKITKFKSNIEESLEQYSSYKIGEKIVVDLKHMPTSIHGNQYLCTFTDVTTRLSTVAYLKTKDQTKKQYIKYMKQIRNKTGSYPKFTHTDGGGEFINKELKDFHDKKGIEHTFTAPYSSLQNPIAERINRTQGEGSVALLTTANLPSTFWEYSVTTFNYVKNRSPHKNLSLSNPITEWNIHNATSCGVDLHDLKTFGSEAYVLDEKSLKNEPKAFRCIYLGPCLDQKGSNFYNLHTKKIFVSKNFTINEQIYPGFEYFPSIYDKNFGTKPPVEKLTPETHTSTPTQHTGVTLSPPENQTVTNAPSAAVPAPASVKIEPNNTGDSDATVIDLIPDHDLIVETPSTPTPPSSPQSQSEVVDVDADIAAFNRSWTHQVGPADMPGLAHPENHPFEDFVNGQPAYEVDSILDKRQSQFTLTGNPRKGGQVWKPSYGYDYLVRWDDGSESWEPQEAVEQAAQKVEEYEVRAAVNQEATETKEEPSPDADTPVETSNLQNLCNFVHLPFFCFLTKLTSRPHGSWKDFKVPNNRKEMLLSPQRDKWIEAEEKEYAALLANKTWKEFDGKPPKKPITCRWVYKIKPPTSIQPEPIFKARLVAHGYKQKPGIDYGATFAQVATMKAFRVFIWFAAAVGMVATQADFSNAFLQGDIDREIYMSAPEGYGQEGEVVRLQKSIYGIVQAPRIWRNTLISHLNTLGFKELISDSCVLKHHTEKFYILVFVDDLILLGHNDQLRSQIEKNLKSKFKVKFYEKLRHFVGFQVDYKKDGSIHVHQTDYIQRILDLFSKYIPEKFSHKTPADPKVTLSTQQQPTSTQDKNSMSKYPYRKLIGCLLYCLGTRPELYYIVVTLSRFVCNPGWIHWLAAIYVLIYLRNTTGLGLIFKANQELKISIYVDADWGSNVDNRKSISGYIIYLGSSPIIWRSKQQKGKPATSSCEAEYISLSNVLNEMVWLKTFLTELGFNVPTPIPIYCDNKSAKDLAYNPVHHDRTKHIDIAYHRIREFIVDGTVIIEHIPTANNPADIFTKNVTVSVFTRLINFIYDCSSSLT